MNQHLVTFILIYIRQNNLSWVQASSKMMRNISAAGILKVKEFKAAAADTNFVIDVYKLTILGRHSHH